MQLLLEFILEICHLDKDVVSVYWQWKPRWVVAHTTWRCAAPWWPWHWPAVAVVWFFSYKNISCSLFRSRRITQAFGFPYAFRMLIHVLTCFRYINCEVSGSWMRIRVLHVYICNSCMKNHSYNQHTLFRHFFYLIFFCTLALFYCFILNSVNFIMVDGEFIRSFSHSRHGSRWLWSQILMWLCHNFRCDHGAAASTLWRASQWTDLAKTVRDKLTVLHHLSNLQKNQQRHDPLLNLWCVASFCWHLPYNYPNFKVGRGSPLRPG